MPIICLSSAGAAFPLQPRSPMALYTKPPFTPHPPHPRAGGLHALGHCPQQKGEHPGLRPGQKPGNLGVKCPCQLSLAQLSISVQRVCTEHQLCPRHWGHKSTGRMLLLSWNAWTARREKGTKARSRSFFGGRVGEPSACEQAFLEPTPESPRLALRKELTKETCK